MELHPIIPVSIDDTISLKRNTAVFSLAAGSVIIPYTTIVWSVKLQQHPKTVFVVIRVLRGILEQNIFAQFSLHKIIPPRSLRTRLPCHSRCPCQHLTTPQNPTLEDSSTPPPKSSSASHSFRPDSLSNPYFLFLSFCP